MSCHVMSWMSSGRQWEVCSLVNPSFYESFPLDHFQHTHNATTFSPHALVWFVEDFRLGLHERSGLASFLVKFFKNCERLCDCCLCRFGISDRLARKRVFYWGLSRLTLPTPMKNKSFSKTCKFA